MNLKKNEKDELKHWKNRAKHAEKESSLLTKSLDQYIRDADETNDALELLIKSIERYSSIFNEKFPEDFVCVLDAVDNAEKYFRKNILNKLTRLSQETGLYAVEHPDFYKKKS